MILIRGLPGSGKSTMARDLVAAGRADIHIETDMWFTNENGVYRFDREYLPLAHANCLKVAKQVLELGMIPVVSNTFSRVWEMQPYIDTGAVTKVLTAIGEYENIHSVPAETIGHMRRRWENYP